MTIAILVAYLALVLLIGLFSHRFFRGTSEDWFVAARTIGPFILLISLFGAHMTSFSLLGASGEAYLEGIGVFALMASSSALVVPAVFFFIGTRVWALGKRRGYLTPVQLFRERWERIAGDAKEQLASLPLAERAQLLAELLTSHGYMAEATGESESEALVREHNCVLRSVAEKFPEVCVAEEQFLAEFLGAVVERRKHIASGASCCEYCVKEQGEQRES